MNSFFAGTFIRAAGLLLWGLALLTCSRRPVTHNDNSVRSSSATPTPTVSQPAISTPTLRYLEVSEKALLNGAINRVYPECPPQVRCEGKVSVHIVIESGEGIVTYAQAQNAHPLLREAVEKAALAWRFKPTMDMPPELRLSGNLIFDFSDNQKTK